MDPYDATEAAEGTPEMAIIKAKGLLIAAHDGIETNPVGLHLCTYTADVAKVAIGADPRVLTMDVEV